jgi:hypothetical protein
MRNARLSGKQPPGQRIIENATALLPRSCLSDSKRWLAEIAAKMINEFPHSRNLFIDSTIRKMKYFMYLSIS